MTEQNKVNKIQVSVPIGGRLVNIIYEIALQLWSFVTCQIFSSLILKNN